MKTNFEAVSAAIPALEKGMGGAALLQTSFGIRLSKIAASSSDLDPVDRNTVVSFFENGASDEEGNPSGQIVGILKGMKDSMGTNLEEAQAEEAKSATGYADLKGSKEKEIEVASESIESKTSRT